MPRAFRRVHRFLVHWITAPFIWLLGLTVVNGERHQKREALSEDALNAGEPLVVDYRSDK